jgi:hypothetical protein
VGMKLGKRSLRNWVFKPVTSGLKVEARWISLCSDSFLLMWTTFQNVLYVKQVESDGVCKITETENTHHMR